MYNATEWNKNWSEVQWVFCNGQHSWNIGRDISRGSGTNPSCSNVKRHFCDMFNSCRETGKRTYPSLTPAQCHYPPAPARPSGQQRRHMTHLTDEDKIIMLHMIKSRILNSQTALKPENKSQHFTMALIWSFSILLWDIRKYWVKNCKP